MTKWFGVVLALLLATSTPSFSAELPGITDTEIKIGGIFPLSGPVSALGTTAKSLIAYVQYINDRGGVNGRKINYVAYDDAYSPPKAVEQARKLVESDDVAFLFSQVGTPGNSAVAKYLASRGVPTIALVSGAAKFTDVASYPLSTTAVVSYEVEGTIYAKYLDKVLPNSKYAILYQNDDLGRDYLKAFQSYFKQDFDQRVLAVAYDVAEPTIDSKVVALKSSDAKAFFIAVTPKFAAQAIRKAAEIGWKPIVIVNSPSSSVAGTLRPAGLENAIGVIVGGRMRDPTDTQWDNDPANGFRAFFQKYLPGADVSDVYYLLGYEQGIVLEQILKQCGNDLSRENILKQAKSIKDFSISTTLVGIKTNTSERVNQLWTQLQSQRWNGNKWEQFGGIEGADME